MSFFGDQHLIQLPKIIVQPGPSPFSSRKRSLSNDQGMINNKQSTIQIHHHQHHQLQQQQHQQQSMIFLDKSTAEQLSSINQSQIQLYQINETDNGSSGLNNQLNPEITIYNQQQQQQHNINDAQSLLDQNELINQFHHISNSPNSTNNSHNSSSNLVDSNNSISTPKAATTNLSNSRNYIQSKRKNSMHHKSGNNSSSNQLPPSSIVPTLTNVDEIFHLLSQKIAKYCQILADLTNCEVFYKAQLPIVNQPGTNDITTSKSSKKIRHQNTDNRFSSHHTSMKRHQNGSRKRSLYWGTHQMLFQYSHNQGLKYDKSGGDSLIKINQRSISNDVTNLIEEILNAPNIQDDNSQETNLTKFISKSKSTDNQVDNLASKSTIKLVDSELEVISLSASTPLTMTSQETLNTDVNINLNNEFNLINELHQAESEQFLDDLNSSSLKITSNQQQVSNSGFTLNDNGNHSGAHESKSQVEIKDCCVYLNRLDDNLIDDYLNKFEMKYNNEEGGYMMGSDIADESIETEETFNGIDTCEVNTNEPQSFSLNDLPSESELYSDEFLLNVTNKFGTRDNNSLHNLSNSRVNNQLMDEDEENDDDDSNDDERTLLEKNCINLNESEINDNDEDYYTCELCEPNNNHSYKHLTQLKIHQLRVHENVPVDMNPPYNCKKCGLNNATFQSDKIAFLKHTLTCYYPHVYTCKTCTQIFDNYSQYLFHTRYIHTHVVYMCAICSRKYKHIKELLDHDQLMHSKTLNYCEICFDSRKSRNDLYDHYKTAHINEMPEGHLEHHLNSESLIELNQEEELNQEGIIIDQSNKSIDLNNDLSAVLSDPNSMSSFVLTDQEIDKNPCKSASIQTTKNTSSDMYKANWGKVQKNDLIRGLLDRKHQCKWCSLRFYTKSQLKQHETTHMNSVLYCPVCDKQFTHKDRLSGHMKCHMEPSLECKVCGKKFKRLCNLYNHELVHGLTEHAFMLCQFCGRGFRSRRDYQNHVIANHRDQLMKTDSNGQNTSLQELNSQAESQNVKKTAESTSQNRRYPTGSRKVKTNQQVKTTTIILNSEQSNLPSSSNSNNSNQMLVNIEPDTYFTRTGVHHFQNIEEETQSEGDILIQLEDEVLS